MTTSRRRFLAASAAATAVAGCSFSVGTNGGLTARAPADGSEVWTADVGEVGGGFAHADGTLYAATSDTLFAVSAADGSELWRFEVDFEQVFATGTPTVTADVVLLPVGKKLYAVSTTTGEEQWRLEADSDVWGTIPAADGVAVVGVGDSTVRGLSLSDGSEQWRLSGEKFGTNSAAVAGDAAVVNSEAGRVHARALADGSERWTHETERPVGGRPAVGAGTVFVGTRAHRVLALSPADGTGQWRFDTSDAGIDVPVGRDTFPRTHVGGGTAYASTKGVLFALSPGDGAVRWTFDPDATDTLWPLVVDDAVYASGTFSERQRTSGSTSAGSEVFAADAASGRQRWLAVFDDPGTPGTPVVGENSVYVRDDEGIVHAFATGDGTEQWTHDTGESVGDPVLADGNVVVGY